MADGSQRPTRRFSAFISYSSEDVAFARRLHRRLETYRLPRRLGGGDAAPAQRLKPLFRDVDELTAHHDLSAAVREALAQSDHLIVICSPRAARSEWVGREIEYFRAVHGDGRILAALIEGDPETAFPPALRTTAAGQPVEPLAADFRRESGFRRLAMLKLVAALAGVELDQLVQRDAQRGTRRVAALAAVAVLAMGAFSGLTWMTLDARAEADRRREQVGGMVEFLMSDVRKALQRGGRLDQLDALNRQALGYFDGEDLNGLSEGDLRKRAKILQAMGEDDEKRGDLELARARFEEARRTTGALLRAKPADTERIFAHSQSEYWVGFINWRAGHRAAARKGFEAYAALARQLTALEPARPEWQMEVGYAENNLGMLAMRQGGDLPAAERHFSASLAIKKALAERAPADVERQRDLANGYAWLADAQRLGSHFALAMENRKTQREILERLLASDPDNLEVRSDLLGVELAVARIHADRRQYKDALALLREGGRSAATLSRLDPSNKSIRRQARAFELFAIKAQLDSGAGEPRTAMGRRLGPCGDQDNLGDAELTAFCEVLSDRVYGARRPPAKLTTGKFSRDVYTPRWGISLSAEANLK